MKHIIKVQSLENLPETRPLIAMDGNYNLAQYGESAGPQIEMVDLGLASGTKWAKYLYGVNPNQLTTASDWYGKYLMWGELEEKAGWDGQGTKVPYDWANYKYATGTYSSSNKKVFIKYVPTDKPEYWNGTGDPDNLTTLEPVDDVASVNYGGNWRIPTKEELEELMALPSQWVNNYDPSKAEHTTDDGGIQDLNGRIFTGTNGNTLFMPAAGYRSTSGIWGVGDYGEFWSSNLWLNVYNYVPHSASRLSISSGGTSMDRDHRYYGLTVCPVC